jgi:2'-5' RNA ligase
MLPLFVTLADINHSSNIWKTVFMELEKSPGLIDLQQQIVNQFSSVQPYEFLPHISLIYKVMTVELKEEIICNLAVRNSYKMDKIIAMKTGPNVEQWEKVLEVTLHA